MSLDLQAPGHPIPLRPNGLAAGLGGISFRRTLFPLLFSLVYATVLTTLPLDVFKDRQNYLTYAEASDVIFARYAIGGWASIFANEPLWLAINVGLARVFGPEAVVRVLIFVPAFLVSFTVLRNNLSHAAWLVLFLLLPQVVKNHVIHLRQGLAISVFLLGYHARSTGLRIVLMGASGLVHASLLFVALIGALVWAARVLHFSPALRVVFFVLCSVALGASMTTVAGALGARQAETYSEAELAVSGLGFVFWSGILSLFLSRGLVFIRDNAFAISILVMYLSLYFLVPVSARVFESAILIVLLACLNLWGWRRQAGLLAVLVYTAASYVLRLDQPWLGFGWV